MDSLWGEEFSVKEEDIKNIIKKIKKPKEVKIRTTEQILKSKVVPIEEKIDTIKKEVYRILGKYIDNTVVIRTVEDLHNYISSAINNKVIAIDTETNNTLNTIDCKLMGLCLYTPGQKNAYIPVNHINIDTEEKLANQVKEEDIKSELQRILDNNAFEIYHNASFDIEVLKSTCGIKMKADWDTQVAAHLIDENELKGLKVQYQLHIDPTQAKYDIEHLFEGLPYEIFDPDLFALYAATDSFMTFKLFEYQKPILEQEDMKDVYNLFKTVEIPVIDAIVNMELEGIKIDVEYAKKLSVEYHKRSNEIQSRIDEELVNLKSSIDRWCSTDEANTPIIGRTGKPGKTKFQQLSNPIDLNSSTQLAILLYDILKVPVVDKKKPRTTDAAALTALAEEKHIKICELMLEKRTVDILIDTFIDALPEFICSDDRIHSSYNQCGSVGGRFSCSKPNCQQIPSHDKLIRMMFDGGEKNREVDEDNNCFELFDYEEVETIDGWKLVKDLSINDELLSGDILLRIKNIIKNNNIYYLYC